jgi:hypothetical protein
MHAERDEASLVESTGPWPFVTHMTFLLPDSTRVVWLSRVHRKRLGSGGPISFSQFTSAVIRCLWMPQELNWWIGVIFALGASLFLLGSVLSFVPELARTWASDATGINRIFFAGSIPFTTAAYLQLFQAANAGEFSPRDDATKQDVDLFGWRPRDIGWLSCALQFSGTLLFNANTFDSLIPGLDWLQQDLVIWIPDVAGSVLFLASGYLAFVETCHAHFAWRPADLSWWVALFNLLGCIAFMISAVFAFVPSHAPGFDAAAIAVLFTLIGAAGFLIGSLLMLPENAIEPENSNTGLD